jgi:cytochrome c biogenesis protein CcmG/thiol:disulfide interchange protein DsbE
MRFLIPLGIFVALVILLAVGLTMDPKRVPSPLIDKPAPDFTLKNLHNPGEKFSPQQYRGKVWVLNVWASWCVSCRAEHRVIKRLAGMNLVDIVGLDYKDKPEDGRAWLSELGNPYTLSVMDIDGKVGIDWGVYGVPETFIIGKDGMIKHKHIGPVTDKALDETIIPLLKSLNNS